VSGVNRQGRNEACACGSGKKYKHCCALARTTPKRDHEVEPSQMSALVSMARAGRYPDMEAKAQELLSGSRASGLLWKALGVALQGQGKEALPALEKAAELLPADAEAHSNLGSALRRTGRLAEAEACYRCSIELEPGRAEVWSNLGNVLRDCGRFEEATAAHRRCLEIKPDYAEGHNNLGSVLLDMGRLDEALLEFRRAVELRPGFALAHSNLGNVLLQKNRSEEAERSCRRALELEPRLAGAMVQWAELEAGKGCFEEAESLMRAALAVEPGNAEALAGLVRFRKMGAQDGEWLERAQGVVSGGVGPRQELYLRYAMGKYFDDVGEFEQAFEQYRRANELSKGHGGGHDREQLERGVERIIETFDGAWLEGQRGAGEESDRAVLVVGMPRSGTTLTEQILAAHPQVFGAGELSYWSEAASGYAARPEGEGEVLRGLGQGYLRVLEGLSSDARRVVDKMPGNFLYLGLIRAALPNVRIIHLRRNPLDTCLSIYFQNFGALHSYANDLEDLGHYYRQYLRLMEHWRGVLPAGAMLEVRYEDLVSDAEGCSRRMVQHMGLDWDARCLEFYLNKGPVSTFSKWQARQKLSSASVERWRRYEKFLDPIRPLLEERQATGSARGIDR
jgi:tetratricopeptide (TPR) repeat protein